jgi:hypothetical protein
MVAILTHVAGSYRRNRQHGSPGEGPDCPGEVGLDARVKYTLPSISLRLRVLVFHAATEPDHHQSGHSHSHP